MRTDTLAPLSAHTMPHAPDGSPWACTAPERPPDAEGVIGWRCPGCRVAAAVATVHAPTELMLHIETGRVRTQIEAARDELAVHDPALLVLVERAVAARAGGTS